MVERSILQCDVIPYTPQTKVFANRVNEQTPNEIPREVSVKYLKDSYFKIDFFVTKRDHNGTFLAVNTVRLVSFRG